MRDNYASSDSRKERSSKKPLSFELRTTFCNPGGSSEDIFLRGRLSFNRAVDSIDLSRTNQSPRVNDRFDLMAGKAPRRRQSRFAASRRQERVRRGTHSRRAIYSDFGYFDPTRHRTDSRTTARRSTESDV